MLYQKEKNELKELIQAGYPLIYIVTPDERPVVHMLKEITLELKEEREYGLRTWDRHHYLYDEQTGQHIVRKKKSEQEGTNEAPFDDPVALLNYIRNKKQHMIHVLHDFHRCYDMKRDSDRRIVRALKNISYDASMSFTEDYTLRRYRHQQDTFYKHTIITAPVLDIPKELEKMAYVIEFSLPQEKEITDILSSMEKEAGLLLLNHEKERVVNALLGLTESEIFYSLKKSMLRNDNFVNSKELLQEKKQLLKKHQMVEYVESDVLMRDVGGMKELATWIHKRKPIFNEQFRTDYHLDIPKGLLLTGVQGCGKSFMVKAIANDLELPLLRLDIGSLMSKWVGESDQNLRTTISLVETISPCVLWLDEMEKSMPQHDGNSHETTQRMFGNLLTWLQEKTSSVFVVATANNIQLLPPELLRKGRFDEIFFVDLPTVNERKEILSIHLTKKELSLDQFNLDKLSIQCEGFSGAEIEVVINEAVLEAAVKGERLSEFYLEKEIIKTNPISRTMKEQIEEIRTWAVTQNVRRVSDEKETDVKRIGF